MAGITDRIPPQNIEAEQSVLGAMLLDGEAISSVTEFLRPGDFYKEAHEKIFRAVVSLAENNEPVDLVTLSEQLRNEGLLEEVGGASYLADLANAVPTAAHVHYYAKIVEEKSLLRQLISASTKIVSMSYEDPDEVDKILDEAEKLIFEVSQKTTTQDFVPVKEILMETFDNIENLYHNQGNVTGLPTGFIDLDQRLSGFQPSDLIILAARPSMGKTTLALNMAQHVSIRESRPVAIFSLEMSKDQLVQRMLCAEANIDAHRLRTGDLTSEDWPKLTKAIGPISEAPIFIDDTASISVMEMRAKARRLKAEHGLEAIFIDYLQLMQGHQNPENRQQEISQISRSLKSLAKELNVPVIALSQLSRAVEQRQDKRPMLSDLLESGGIEANADVVLFIYRDGYYNSESEKPNIAEVIVAKQRNGPVGTVELFFKNDFNKFLNTEYRYDEQVE
ncbi:replicative DNA helicase [Natranaerobius thermophilus]|uniref:Replicative DNA helicase n=1 Tax=Natranaerobius thermophilus (strain ATCC BAA-1301 / DSM 18059 / JW/NM-WN-LF) TaxID=457570 RepID=B2A450_NATTJ|nr:replicative DNA helicase [Natranaerobius thermophilus]ACB86456.1 primary replicative DNA helicase [Natranaerobius thermophilus JW/NM-WN-LF]